VWKAKDTTCAFGFASERTKGLSHVVRWCLVSSSVEARSPSSVNMGPFESEFSEFGVSVSLKIPNYFIL